MDTSNGCPVSIAIPSADALCISNLVIFNFHCLPYMEVHTSVKYSQGVPSFHSITITSYDSNTQL